MKPVDRIVGELFEQRKVTVADHEGNIQENIIPDWRRTSASESPAKRPAQGNRGPMFAAADNDRILAAEWDQRAYEDLRSATNPCHSPARLCEAGFLLARMISETAAEQRQRKAIDERSPFMIV